jgi:hypothetical protein
MTLGIDAMVLQPPQHVPKKAAVRVTCRESVQHVERGQRSERA